jgi:hypothetical protein
MATAVGAVVMGALTGVGMIFGQVPIPIPSPADAGAWSFYGVLIVGICVLGGALGLVVRWVATKFLVELEANRMAREDSNRVLEKLSDNIERQNEFNESQGKEALRRAYSYPFLGTGVAQGLETPVVKGG